MHGCHRIRVDIALVPNGYEEQNGELKDNKGAHRESNRSLVDSLVDFSWNVTKVEVIAVNHMLENHIEKTEWRD